MTTTYRESTVDCKSWGVGKSFLSSSHPTRTIRNGDLCLASCKIHYNDVIMVAIASLITSLTIVYSTVYSDADQRKHQSSASLAFVWGIHRGPVNSPHKWPVTRKCFHLMTSSCINLNICTVLLSLCTASSPWNILICLKFSSLLICRIDLLPISKQLILRSNTCGYYCTKQLLAPLMTYWELNLCQKTPVSHILSYSIFCQ